MSTVRMKTASCGPAGNRVAGQVCSVTPDEGAALVQGGFAEWVEPPREKAVEAAVMPERENAALRTKPTTASTRKRA